MIFFGGHPCDPQHNNMHIVQWYFFHKTYTDCKASIHKPWKEFCQWIPQPELSFCKQFAHEECSEQLGNGPNLVHCRLGG